MVDSTDTLTVPVGAEGALEGKLRQQVETLGFGRALELAHTSLDRRCIEASHLLLSDEEAALGYVHAGFAMTALPHKRTDATEWVRDGGDLRLRVESGKTHDGTTVGIPFGYVARLILLYLQTEAIRTRSREVELGRSMHSWLKAMGLNSGGKGYEAVREQSRRLSLCRLTFYRLTENTEAVLNGGFVREAILPGRDKGSQMSLWRETVVLDEVFYESLVRHPLPLREAAIRALSGRSMGIDLYVWLAYRLHHLAGPTRVPWPALYRQFGAGFAQPRQFRAHAREALALALAAYPEALVRVDDDALILLPSPPPVPERVRLPSTSRHK
ncbi:replication protein RepA [Roseomonas mucosa]|uniref:replication protein RepA n=1 Tax=Roseomonas mucosa TaxID=207340 RepID=UPI0012385DE1|nr:replication protein RepA [Roseomonas mucosa]QET91494.1 pirin [Roseomonas mucosa]